jgi:hypothetical protein
MIFKKYGKEGRYLEEWPMTCEEYYDKFYDWAESTQIKKLSSVDVLGPADEVAEVMMELAFHHEDIVNRIARRAIDQNLIFSTNNLMDNIYPYRSEAV